MRRTIKIFAGVVAALAVWTLMSSAANAQLAVTSSPAGSPALGNTIRGASTTVFAITTSGVVTRQSGDAIRVGPSVVATPTVTITCGFLNLSSLCALRPVRVTITPVTGSGPAQITKLRVSSVSGYTYRSGAPAESSAIVFDMNPIGLLGSAVFKLGMDVQLAAGAASGQYPTTYSVTAQFI